jgi:hypothetical protein
MSTRMLRWMAPIAAAGLAAVILVASASAGASTRHARVHASAAAASAPYTFSFKPNKPGVSTAATFTLTSAQQPTSATITLPAKTLLNLKAVPVCGAPPACGPTTQVGTGKATINYTNAAGTTYKIPLSFQVFNRSGGLAVVITVPNAAPVVILPTWSGTSLTIPYPNGNYNGLPIEITQVSLSFSQLGSGKGALLRTPATCTKAGWSSTASLTSSTGAVTHLKSTAKCQKPKPKPKPKKKPPKKG